MNNFFKALKVPQASDIREIKPFLLARPQEFCEYSFANIIIWSELFATKVALHEDLLFIYSSINDVLLFPVGRELSGNDFIEIGEILLGNGLSGNIGLVPQHFVDHHPELNQLYEVRRDHKNQDYIYLTADLAHLPGNRFHSKKNLVNQFRKNNPSYRAEPLNPDDFLDCLQLAEIWCKVKDCQQTSFYFEMQAIQKALREFRQLEMEGLKITIRGKIEAFAVYSQLNGETADIHFEKFNPAIKGLAQVINQETAQALESRYRYLNREQDLGIEGLRKAKLSYHPAKIVTPCFLKRIR